jgi:hypothetical protein
MLSRALGGERERAEKELFHAIEAARRAYDAAKEESSRFADMANDPDGAATLHKSIEQERIRKREYRRALDVYLGFVSDGRTGCSGES